MKGIPRTGNYRRSRKLQKLRKNSSCLPIPVTHLLPYSLSGLPCPALRHVPTASKTSRKKMTPKLSRTKGSYPNLPRRPQQPCLPCYNLLRHLHRLFFLSCTQSVHAFISLSPAYSLLFPLSSFHCLPLLLLHTSPLFFPPLFNIYSFLLHVFLHLHLF